MTNSSKNMFEKQPKRVSYILVTLLVVLPEWKFGCVPYCIILSWLIPYHQCYSIIAY